MNPIMVSTALGFGVDQILNYLSKSDPTVNSLIGQARSAGYANGSIVNHLMKMFSGVKVDPKFERYVTRPLRESDIMKRPNYNPEIPDSSGGGGLARSIASGLIGAGVTAALGSGKGGKIAQALLNRGTGQEEGEEQEIETSTDPQTSSEPQKPNLIKQFNEGVDLTTLTQPQLDKMSQLEKQLMMLERKGRGTQHKSVQKIFDKRDQILARQGMNTREEEADRFERGYGKGPFFEQSKTEEKITEQVLPTSTEKTDEITENTDVMTEKAEQTPEITAQKEEKPISQGIGIEGVSPENQKLIDAMMEGMPAKAKTVPLTKKDVTPIQALKSSNVRGASYHPDGTLQVVFDSGAAYQYPNVEQSDVQKMLEGANSAVTDGESIFRAYYSNKNPSIGSAFNEFIKKNAEKYPPEKIDPKELRDTGLKAIRKADKVEKAAQYFDVFKNFTEKSKSKTQKTPVKALTKALDDLPDDVQDQLIYLARKRIQEEDKQKKAAGKRGKRTTPKNIAKELEQRLKRG